MDEKLLWKKRLNSTINQLSNQLKVDLYDNVVVPVVKDWFAGSDSIGGLNETIKQKLNDAWPIAQRKIESAFLEFEDSLKTDIHKAHELSPSAELKLDEAEATISAAVANIIGPIVAAVSGTILGGSGVALLAQGPIGWIIGAILGGLVFFFGKKTIQDVIIEPALHHRRIPVFIKKRAKSKVGRELELNAPKFEQGLYEQLKEQSTPLYKALDNLPNQET